MKKFFRIQQAGDSSDGLYSFEVQAETDPLDELRGAGARFIEPVPRGGGDAFEDFTAFVTGSREELEALQGTLEQRGWKRAG